jgi:hypothetical protein
MFILSRGKWCSDNNNKERARRENTTKSRKKERRDAHTTNSLNNTNCPN